nr:hypothetical protein [Natronosalvus vescus]
MTLIHGQLAWMIGTIFVLSVLGSFSYTGFFSLSLLGLLVVTELTSPINVTPKWKGRLRWIILVGIAGFLFIVIRRIYMMIPPEVLP